MDISSYSIFQNKGAHITEGNKIARDLLGFLYIFLGVILLLSLATFDAADPHINHTFSPPVEIKNGAGVFGAYASGFIVDFFGIASYMIAVAVLIAGLRRIMVRLIFPWWRTSGIILLGLCISTAASGGGISLGDIYGGGLIGDILYAFFRRFLGVRGAAIFWLFLFMVAVQLFLGISWVSTCHLAWEKFTKTARMLLLKIRDKIHTVKLGMPVKTLSAVKHGPENEQSGSYDADDSPVKDLIRFPGVFSSDHAEANTSNASLEAGGKNNVSKQLKNNFNFLSEMEFCPEESSPQADQPAQDIAIQSTPNDSQMLDGAIAVEPVMEPGQQATQPIARKRNIVLPPISILSTPKPDENRISHEVLAANGKNLVNSLADFGVQADLVGIIPGPVVTMYELRPAPGIKVSRIAGLSDDLALSLKAVAVRIQAPIPGTDTVGVEVPNEHRETVSFKDLLASDAFMSSPSLLSMALGKDISGAPSIADLARMPHLLVAGATGAGKSVCINAILLSLLFKAKPSELQLLLVDPKRIELAVYADLPHLVHPVVTEMSMAKNALEWAVQEMDRRYMAIAQVGVRNISGYNEKLANLKKENPESVQDLEPMPYLVIIIDELADLMMTAGKDIETSIVRLAQLARAAGIHLILATQRPSVNIVTGLIKANFPCRISFQVTSSHDSRTILDAVGAEHLLGKGDMLFKPGGGKLQRLHGAFVSDDDVAAVVGFWKKQLPPSYKVDFASWNNNDQAGSEQGGGGDDLGNDPMYSEAVAFVMQQGKASISLIQRRFRIGFNRAARFVEQMEKDGVIGPQDGSKPRIVIRGRDAQNF